MEELDIWLQAEVKVQARRPAVPKERRRLTANQVKLHIQEIAIQLRKALITKEMARKALMQGCDFLSYWILPDFHLLSLGYR
jgi:hypothetical protein